MRRLRKWVKVTGMALFFGVPCTILYNTGVVAETTPTQSKSKPVQILQTNSANNSFAELKGKTLQKMYLLQDSVVYADSSNISTTTQTLSQGENVSIVSADGAKVKVLTNNGEQGYVDVSNLTDNKKNIFVNAKKTLYAKNDGVVVKVLPDNASSELATLKKNDEVIVTGTNDSGYVRIRNGEKTGYILESCLMKEKDIPKPAKIKQEKELAPHWNGPRLSSSRGSVIGPSGKETYYNLDMSGCINVMRRMGNNDRYWIRNDGAKMLGNYIMCAANLSVHPKGSIVPSSLGDAIVVDTGGFAAQNANQLDLAVNW